MLDLESLLVSPVGFGLSTATPIQRACCRMLQGTTLGALGGDPSVVGAVGGPGAVETYEQLVARAQRPLEIWIVAAIRCGKSLLGGACSLYHALTLPIPVGMKRTDEAWATTTSLSVKQAEVVGQHTLGAVQRSPVLRRLLLPEPRPSWERFVLRRPDGYRVRFLVRAGRKGGSNLVSRFNFCSVFDEAARMQGQEDGIINFEDGYKAVSARLKVIGAPLVVVTSPWAARGPVYEAVQRDWGKPTRIRIVIRATGPEMNPMLWTPEACELERLNPDGAYETDVLGQFVDPEAGFLTAAQVKAATRETPTERPREQGVEYTAAMDPATAGNAWTLVIVGKRAGENESDDRYFVALARQWQGSRSEPLRARVVFGEMAPILQSYGLSEVHTDRWAATLIAEHGDYAGVTVQVASDTRDEQSRQYSDFRLLVLDGRLELAPVPALRADLLMVRKKLQQGGAVRYDMGPVTRDGRHADFAPAAVLAVARAKDSPSWVSAMQRWKAGGGVL